MPVLFVSWVIERGSVLMVLKGLELSLFLVVRGACDVAVS